MGRCIIVICGGGSKKNDMNKQHGTVHKRRHQGEGTQWSKLVLFLCEKTILFKMAKKLPQSPKIAVLFEIGQLLGI